MSNPLTDEPFHPVYDPPRDLESVSPAVGHPKANKTLIGPPGTGVGDLECEIFVDTYAKTDGEGEFDVQGTRSRFIVHADQLKLLANGAHIVLEVMHHPTPPVWIGIEPPLCPECQVDMEWDDTLETFVCRDAAHQEPEEEDDADDEMGSGIS